MKILRITANRIIGIYRMIVSPFLGRSCRFHPSCSEYMQDAIMKKGLVVGIYKGVCRIFRCNPFSAGGYDPVE